MDAIKKRAFALSKRLSRHLLWRLFLYFAVIIGWRTLVLFPVVLVLECLVAIKSVCHTLWYEEWYTLHLLLSKEWELIKVRRHAPRWEE